MCQSEWGRGSRRTGWVSMCISRDGFAVAQQHMIPAAVFLGVWQSGVVVVIGPLMEEIFQNIKTFQTGLKSDDGTVPGFQRVPIYCKICLQLCWKLAGARASTSKKHVVPASFSRPHNVGQTAQRSTTHASLDSLIGIVVVSCVPTTAVSRAGELRTQHKKHSVNPQGARSFSCSSAAGRRHNFTFTNTHTHSSSTAAAWPGRCSSRRRGSAACSRAAAGPPGT